MNARTNAVHCLLWIFAFTSLLWGCVEESGSGSQPEERDAVPVSDTGVDEDAYVTDLGSVDGSLMTDAEFIVDASLDAELQDAEPPPPPECLAQVGQPCVVQLAEGDHCIREGIYACSHDGPDAELVCNYDEADYPVSSVCDDGLDNDCDGVVDERDSIVDIDHFSYSEGGISWTHECVMFMSGKIVCLRRIIRDGVPSIDGSYEINKEGLIPVAFDAGGRVICVAFDDNSVSCWGNNWNGVADPRSDERFVGSDMEVVDESWGSIFDAQERAVVDVSVSITGGCVLYLDGGVVCWGDFQHSGDIQEPTEIDFSGRSVVGVDSEHYTMCFVLSDGQVRCWEEDHNYVVEPSEFGRHDFPLDETVSYSVGAHVALSINVGGYHVCALFEDGRVRCWGDNSYGACGNLSNYNDGSYDYVLTHEPGPNGEELGVPAVDVGEVGEIVGFSVGGLASSCVLDEFGRVKCWGNGLYTGYEDGLDRGQDPENEMGQNLPFVDFGTGAVVEKLFDDCVFLTSGELKCWGARWGINGPGSMGDNLPVVPIRSCDSGY